MQFLAVLYTEDGILENALSTGYEAESCYMSKAKNSFGGISPNDIFNLAALCSDIVLEL